MDPISSAVTGWGGLAVGFLSLIAGIISVVFAVQAARAAKNAENAAEDAKTAAQTAQEGFAAMQSDFEQKKADNTAIAVYRLHDVFFLQNVTSYPLHNVHYAAAETKARPDDWAWIEKPVPPGETVTLHGVTDEEMSANKMLVFWELKEHEDQPRLGRRRIDVFAVVTVPPVLLHGASMN